MEYTVKTEGLTIQVKDTILYLRQYDGESKDIVVVFGEDLGTIKAIRRALTDIIDADKRRSLTTGGDN